MICVKEHEKKKSLIRDKETQHIQKEISSGCRRASHNSLAALGENRIESLK